MNIAEPSLLFGGIVSLCVAAAISYLGPRLGWLRFDHGRGPQRIHDGHTPRVGGIAVFSGCCVAFLVFSPPSLGAFMLVCAFPVFLIGVAEDLTNRVSAFVRLLISILSAGLLAVGLDVVITDTGFQAFDSILQIQVLAVALSIYAITAHCHAVNIIDGLNGLAAGSCVRPSRRWPFWPRVRRHPALHGGDGVSCTDGGVSAAQLSWACCSLAMAGHISWELWLPLW